MCRLEIPHFFTLTDADRWELPVHFPNKVRLGAALQLGFLRMTGTTLAATDYVPRAVRKHLGAESQCLVPEITTPRALYRVERTLYAASPRLTCQKCRLRYRLFFGGFWGMAS